VSDPLREDGRTLTEADAYDAMLVFLAAYWERRGKQSEDLGVLLGSTQRLGDGGTLDPARWHDWRRAVDSVVKPKPVEKSE